MQPRAEAKRIRAASSCSIPLAGPCRGDPDRLQQVVWNLLSNAVKFTPRGGPIEVAARARRLARRDQRAATPAWASPRSSCRTCSIASARPTPRRRGARRARAGPVDRQAAGRAARRHGAREEPGGRARRDLRRRPADRSGRAPTEPRIGTIRPRLAGSRPSELDTPDSRRSRASWWSTTTAMRASC